MIRNDSAKAWIFDTLVMDHRHEVISWLRSKYEKLRYEDAEDIFQDAAVALWFKYQEMKEVSDSLVGLMKQFCKFNYTHWLQKKHNIHDVDWDNSYYPLEDEGEITEFGWVGKPIADKFRKERIFAEIDHLQPKDRDLIYLRFENVRMDEIARRLGFRNAQVARNRNCKIVARLRERINGQAQDACPSLSRNSFLRIMRATLTSCPLFVFIPQYLKMGKTKVKVFVFRENVVPLSSKIKDAHRFATYAIFSDETLFSKIVL